MAAASDIYFDYNATAPLLPAAFARMQDAWQSLPGNPSSPHAFGQAARNALETARAGLARLIGCPRRDLLFTSGGSESNSMLLRAVAEGGLPAHVLTSPIEHPSVLRACEWLQSRGVAVEYLPVSSQGVVDVAAAVALLRPETRLVSVMAVNNETGVAQPLERLAQAVRGAPAGRDVMLHTDAVQGFGRIPLPVFQWGFDAVTVTAHKLGGPKGIGALAVRRPDRVAPLILGGRQERGRRAGTESAALALGFLAAAEWVWERFADMAGRLESLRQRLERRLATAPGFFVVGAEAPRVPNTACVGYEGIAAQSLLVALDLRGLAVSTGSACSSGALEPSHVLRAMGLPDHRTASALRFSLGWGSTEIEVDRAAEIVLAETARLRAGLAGQGGSTFPAAGR